uniref:Uncharacterized protein n=1 Tax=Panagrolaimus sp. JU765 TaxID=591449 RepID=A0AC34RQ12_9BILA
MLIAHDEMFANAKWLFKCSLCKKLDNDVEQHLKHIQEEMAAANNPVEQIIPQADVNNDMITIDGTEQVEPDEPMDQEENDNLLNTIEETTSDEIALFDEEDEEASFLVESMEDEREAGEVALKDMFEHCMALGYEFEIKSNLTKKTIASIFSSYESIIFKAFEVLTTALNANQVAEVKRKTRKLFDVFSSEYKWEQYMKNLKCYIAPVDVRVGERIETRLVNGRHEETYVDNFAASVSLSDILKAFLSSHEIADSLLMPSDFQASTNVSHPFSATRVQEMFQTTGDCIFIQVSMDDLATTSPIGPPSVAYKLCGCYLSVLNLPWWLHHQLDYIFLKFLAFSSDITQGNDAVLRDLLITELKSLEQTGIVIHRRGRETRMKVVLFQLIGDNLGLVSAYGLKKSFQGDGCCRVCKANEWRITKSNEIGQLRTAEEYDRIVANGNVQEMQEYGINYRCTFNELENYHFIMAPTVDMMHDILEGHVLYLAGNLFQELSAEYGDVKINSLIEGFPYEGKFKKNKPTALDCKKASKQANSFCIKNYTAKKALNLVRVLPLILANDGIFPEGPLWYCLLQLLRILDYLLAYELPRNKLDELEKMIKEYVKDYIDANGYMTIKTHHLLHYVEIIKKLGMPRYYWSMKFEAKHQPIKQYGTANHCHKNLTKTLANKMQRMTAFKLREVLNEGDYNQKKKLNVFNKKFKIKEAIVYAVNDGRPQFGIIKGKKDDGKLCVQEVISSSWQGETNSYTIERTNNLLIIDPETLPVKESIPVIKNVSLILPYAVF